MASEASRIVELEKKILDALKSRNEPSALQNILFTRVFAPLVVASILAIFGWIWSVSVVASDKTPPPWFAQQVAEIKARSEANDGRIDRLEVVIERQVASTEHLIKAIESIDRRGTSRLQELTHPPKPIPR